MVQEDKLMKENTLMKEKEFRNNIKDSNLNLNLTFDHSVGKGNLMYMKWLKDNDYKIMIVYLVMIHLIMLL